MGIGKRLRQAWRSFRENLLFYPVLMMVGAILLFVAVSALDSSLAGRLEAVAAEPGSVAVSLLFAGSPDSAGRLLSAIVGTWATIVGVVYSVTLVTIQLSATKYSAQVIPVFEEDRLNQVTLGAFTGTFVYSLLVLKSIRAPAEEDGFVPFIGVNVAILLALTSLALLLAFIGNLTAYIRPTRFVRDYAGRSHENLARLNEPAGVDGFRPMGRAREPPPGAGVAVRASSSGFVHKLDWAGIRDALREDAPDVERVDVLVVLGEHVQEGDEVLRAHGPRELDEAARKRLDDAVRVSRTGNPDDPDRMADTLADVGVTALSGGATDVGVAKEALRALVRITVDALGQEDPGPVFALTLEGRSVLVVRERERFREVALRHTRRILTKTRDEGYWDVAEDFALHSGRLLRAAADADGGAWSDLTAWLRGVAPLLFGFDDPPSRTRILERLAAGVEDLRRRGHDAKADELEVLLLDVAREEGFEREARDVLARRP